MGTRTQSRSQRIAPLFEHDQESTLHDPPLPSFPSLPSHEEIDSQFDLIASSWLLQLKEKSVFENDIKFPPSRCVKGIGKGLTAQFHEEFRHDTELLELRLQRLQMRLLPYILEKVEQEPQPDLSDPAWNAWHERSEQTSISKLWKAAYRSKDHRSDPIETVALIHRLNQFLPEAFKLRADLPLQRTDSILTETIASALRYGRSTTTAERTSASRLLEEAKTLSKQVRELFHQPMLFSDQESPSFPEHVVSESWDRYRSLIKELATMEQLSSWFSPSYGSSGKGQRGSRQSVEPNKTDYQRWSMRELDELQREFLRLHFRPCTYEEHAETLLFPNGLSAFAAILRRIENDYRSNYAQDKGETLELQTKDIYFEVDQAIAEHARRSNATVESLDPGDTEGIKRAIRERFPRSVYLTPLTNMYELRATDVREILTSLTESGFSADYRAHYSKLGFLVPPKMFVVIDNTMAGQLADWKNLSFDRLPSFVKLYSFESLVKYGQDGLDLTSAGAVTCIGEWAAAELRSARSDLGATPPEDTVRKLGALLQPDIHEERVKRHSRNSLLIAEILQDSSRVRGSFINDVVHPGLKDHPDYELAKISMPYPGSRINLGLRIASLNGYTDLSGYKPFTHNLSRDAIVVANTFAKLVLELGRKTGVEINQGSSYGFNTTRIAVYQREATDAERRKVGLHVSMPYLRVAVGTENIKDAELVAAIIVRANEIFTSALKERRFLGLYSALRSGSDKFTLLSERK